MRYGARAAASTGGGEPAAGPPAATSTPASTIATSGARRRETGVTAAICRGGYDDPSGRVLERLVREVRGEPARGVVDGHPGPARPVLQLVPAHPSDPEVVAL